MRKILEKTAVKIIGSSNLVDVFIAMLTGTLVNYCFSSYSNQYTLWLNILSLSLFVVMKLTLCRAYKLCPAQSVDRIFARYFKKTIGECGRCIISIFCIFYSILSLFLVILLLCSLKSDKIAINEELKQNQVLEYNNYQSVFDQLEKISSDIDTLYLDMQSSTNILYERINEIESRSMKNEEIVDVKN